jgi:hypothetical protein
MNTVSLVAGAVLARYLYMRQPQTGLPELIITYQTGLLNLSCFLRYDDLKTIPSEKPLLSHGPRLIFECANPVPYIYFKPTYRL